MAGSGGLCGIIGSHRRSCAARGQSLEATPSAAWQQRRCGIAYDVSMPSFSRRAFVQAAASLLPASQLALAWDKLSHANLGFQVYTVRNIIDSDPAGVLKQVHDIGYGNIEGTQAVVEKNWDAIQASGLKPVSIHLSMKPTDEQLADAKKKGFQFAVIPYVGVESRGGVDVMKKLAAQFNEAGKRAKDNGLTLCYHNHAFEFEPMNGTRPLDILMGETKPEYVQLEMDIFWVTVAGNDPVQLLKKYSGRVPLLHLKDKEKGVPAKPQYNENVPKDTFKEVGNGTINIPAVLKAASSAGVKQYFVEQDQSPDPIASLRQSYQYLSKHFST
ncbi:MAG: sugar phosphate isomerase/epimerase [Rhodospirillales bacterium]|nr:sugar phosphate isomerase/epimerase [Acetobacter sp.]